MTPNQNPPAWHQLEIERVIDRLNADLENGLTEVQVQDRIEKYGKNELETKKPKPIWLKFLLQFNQPLLYVLLGAGATKAIWLFMGFGDLS